jgi:hypothetical protein
MSNISNPHWLAQKFITQREIIEAAETPFSKLAMFVLPIISPLVPATMTGMHLYQIFLDVFTFSGSEYLSGGLAIIAGIVLELLGYVGAITFIKSTFNYFSTQKSEYLIPMLLNGLSYTFYLVILFMINYQLGKYLGVSPILNNIIATLSFITVPTSLLAGSHLSEKSWSEKQDKEDERLERIRKEQISLELSNAEQERLYKLERYRLKHGNVSTSYLESSKDNGKKEESSKKVPDWRKLRPTLSREDMEKLANLTPDRMRTYASDTNLTYKTISNYRLRAREELGLENNENQ